MIILFSLVLSLIGTMLCSTGGGIRTTALVALDATVIGMLRRRGETVIRHYMISHTVVYHALAIFTGNVVMVSVTIGAVLLYDSEKYVGAMVALQGAAVACSTIGISPGPTPFLDDSSLITLSIMTFIGRVGLMSSGPSVFIHHTSRPGRVMSEARITVG